MAFLKFQTLKSPLFWLICVLTVGIGVVAKTTYVMVDQPQEESQIEKLTVVVEKQNLGVKVQASGTVEPIQNVNISPKNPGILARLMVEQGEIVKQGQVLAVMENAEIQAQGLQAQANVNEALANLEKAQVRIQGDINQSKARAIQAQARLDELRKQIPKDIDQAKAKVVEAQSRFELAKTRLERYQYLQKEGAVDQDRFDEVMNEYRSAEASLFDAQQRVTQLRETAEPQIKQQEALVLEAQLSLQQQEANVNSEIKQLQSAVASAQAQLKQVEIKFRDTIIMAPFAGIITQKFATEGAFVTPTTSASSTASATSSSILALAKGLEVVAKVPEVDLAQLKVGQGVDIIADAYPDEVFQGQIKRIAPEAIVEQNVTSFEVVISLLSGQEKLRSKMNVDVTFKGDDLVNVLVVPTVAIVTQEGQTGVFVADPNDKPQFKPVTLGISLEDKTQILQGLLPGDRIFIDLPEDYKIDEKNDKS